MEKYHSVDRIFNNCGEILIDPKLFWFYKLFEPGLTKSETNTPCADREFTVLKNTTHGIGPIKMTLDLYAPSGSGMQVDRYHDFVAQADEHKLRNLARLNHQAISFIIKVNAVLNQL